MLKNILALCCILLLLSCGEKNRQGYKISDSMNYSDFQIIYEYSHIDYYSSKDSTFCRSYYDSTSKIKCSLDVTDKIKILKSMEDNEFLDLPEILPEDKNGECTLPSFPVKIIAIFGNVQKSVLHQGRCDVKHKNQLKRFEEILNVISQSIYSKKEIKRLKQTDQVFE